MFYLTCHNFSYWKQKNVLFCSSWCSLLAILSLLQLWVMERCTGEMSCPSLAWDSWHKDLVSFSHQHWVFSTLSFKAPELPRMTWPLLLPCLPGVFSKEVGVDVLLWALGMDSTGTRWPQTVLGKSLLFSCLCFGLCFAWRWCFRARWSCNLLLLAVGLCQPEQTDWRGLGKSRKRFLLKRRSYFKHISEV